MVYLNPDILGNTLNVARLYYPNKTTKVYIIYSYSLYIFIYICISRIYIIFL